MDPQIIVTIALVVLCSSILVFFAQEFGNFFKKIFAIPGLKLILPLALASWIVIFYENWVRWILLWLQSVLIISIHKITNLLPFTYNSIIIKIIVLFVISGLPLWIFKGKVKYKKMKTPTPHSLFWVCLSLWTFTAFLLVLAGFHF